MENLNVKKLKTKLFSLKNKIKNMVEFKTHGKNKTKIYKKLRFGYRI